MYRDHKKLYSHFKFTIKYVIIIGFFKSKWLNAPEMGWQTANSFLRSKVAEGTSIPACHIQGESSPEEGEQKISILGRSSMF